MNTADRETDLSIRQRNLERTIMQKISRFREEFHQNPQCLIVSNDQFYILQTSYMAVYDYMSSRCMAFNMTVYPSLRIKGLEEIEVY